MNDPQWLAHAFQSHRPHHPPRQRSPELARPRSSSRSDGRRRPLSSTTFSPFPSPSPPGSRFEDRTALRPLARSPPLALPPSPSCSAIALFGPGFIDQVIGSSRTFTLDASPRHGRAVSGCRRSPPSSSLPCLGGLASTPAGPRGRFIAPLRRPRPSVIGILLMTGCGVIYNALFDLIIAMMLGSAFLLPDPCRSLRVAPSAPVPHRPGARRRASRHPLHHDQSTTRSSITSSSPPTSAARRCGLPPSSASAPSHARSPARTLALCYWAGRSSVIEFFNFGQRARLEPGYDTAFARPDRPTAGSASSRKTRTPTPTVSRPKSTPSSPPPTSPSRPSPSPCSNRPPRLSLWPRSSADR